MFGKLLLLFIIVPLIELAILIDIGSRIGVDKTIGLVILTGIIGAYLAKKEGLRIVNDIKEKIQQNEMPADELFNGLIILIAGVLLITPGVITDIFGLLMLFRPTRENFKEKLKNKYSSKFKVHSSINI
ncbi:FxsA family protein [candidate division KSB1 bacterium]